MSVEIFNCRKCEVIVESPSGNALVVCASCGEPYSSPSIADLPVSLIPSQSSDAIAASVKRQLSDSRHMKVASITIESVEGVYVPIFITKTTIQGTWKGYHTSPHYTSGVGAESSSNADKVWDFESIDEVTDYPLIASTSGTNFGMELFHRTLFDQQSVGLRDVDWNAVESIGADGTRVVH